MLHLYHVKYFTAGLLFLSGLVSYAKTPTSVWHNPEGKQNIETYFPGNRTNVTEVEFRPDETIVRMNVRNLRPWNKITIPSSTIITSGSDKYVLKSIDGHEPDSPFNPSIIGIDELVLHFEPLPSDCNSFDLMMGENIQDVKLTGIKPRSTKLDESCWRNDKTGEWVIGFFPEGVIYDGHLWTYINQDNKSGKFTITDGNNEIKIEVGKEKNGKRDVRIDEKPFSLNRIIENTLPAYPNKEYKTQFDDTKYMKQDSVTISGWIRGLPDIVTQHTGKTVTVVYDSPVARGQEKIYAEMDSLGLFSLSFPIPNTINIILDAKSTGISFPVEPGKNYFVLEDYAGNKRMVMGDDVRVQNEILSYNLSYIIPEIAGSTETIIKTADEWQNTINIAIDSIVKMHPTLSDLFIDYMHNSALLEMAFCLGQSRFHCPKAILPEDLSAYIRENYWDKIPSRVSPYAGSGAYFINDFVDSEYFNSEYMLSCIVDDGNQIMINVPPELVDTLRTDMQIIRQDERIVEDNGISLPPDNVKKAMERVYETIKDFMQDKSIDYWDIIRLNTFKSVLDNLGTSEEAADIVMTRIFGDSMYARYAPLAEEMEQYIDSVFNGQLFKNFVKQENEKYKAMQSAASSSEIIINRDEDVKYVDNSTSLMHGEELFNEIIEPYKGRPVLIDIWGTWCGPCKAAMKEFQHERKTLEPYNLVFIFFANNSSDDTIKSVITANNVTGENVVHYNLPPDQQCALEQFLKISGYPHYTLVGSDGKIIDTKVDARNLEELEKILKQITGK